MKMAHVLYSASALGCLFLGSALTNGIALASDDVAPVVIDNGGTVPEPDILALFSLGAIGLAAVRLKRHKRGDKNADRNDD